MNSKDSLGDRMKGYENISRNYLTRHIPVIIRLDMKAGHTFTRGFDKPFDKIFIKTMQDTTKYLCENIQGCVFGYCQSDEITLVLTDYKNIKTDAWFGYNIQKMSSISASMATIAFNKYFAENVKTYKAHNKVNYKGKTESDSDFLNRCKKSENLIRRYEASIERGAMFDSRCFSIPKEEVCNCLIFRQQDATRNSIEAVGQANFSQKELNGKSCNKIQDMLFTEKGINWNDFSTVEKRGTCCIKQPVVIREEEAGDLIARITRQKWVIDTEIPIFTQNRYYVEEWLG